MTKLFILSHTIQQALMAKLLDSDVNLPEFRPVRHSGHNFAFACKQAPIRGIFHAGRLSAFRVSGWLAKGVAHIGAI